MIGLQCLLVNCTLPHECDHQKSKLGFAIYVCIIKYSTILIVLHNIILGNTPFSDSTQGVALSTQQRARSPTSHCRSSGTPSSYPIPPQVQPGVYLLLC